MKNSYYLTTILFCDLCFRELFQGKVYGQENVPLSGPFIVAPNHLSHLDPPMIGAVFRKREMMFLGRKTLFKAGFWNTLLSHINVIPVDKENIVNIRALKRAFAALRDGLGLVIFPEGTRSLDGYFGTAQPGIGFLACKTQVPVIPVRIFGTYEILKKNCIIPNLYLSAQIVIGKALLPEQYDHFRGEKDRYNRTADYIFEAIKHLTLP